MRDVELQIRASLEQLRSQLQTARRDVRGFVSSFTQTLGRTREFEGLRESVRSTFAEFRNAQREVRELQRAMAASGEQGNVFAGALQKAENRVRTAGAAYQRNKQALAEMRKQLQAAGVDTTRLSAEQERLGQSVQRAAERSRQAARVATARQNLDLTPLRDVERQVQRIQASYNRLARSGQLSSQELRLANRRMRDSIREVRRQASGLSTEFGVLRSAATGFVAGIGLSLGGLVQQTREAARFGSEIANTADKLGVTTDELQEFRFAAQKFDIETNTASLGLQRFTRRLGEARNGAGELLPTLQRYGIQLQDANGTSREALDVLGDLADVIRGIEDPAEQLAVAFKAFDSEGAALVNVLREGRGGFEAFRREAQLAGAILDEDIVRRAQAANTTLGILGAALKVNLTEIFVRLTPALIDLTDALNGALRGFSSLPGPIQAVTAAIAGLWLVLLPFGGLPVVLAAIRRGFAALPLVVSRATAAVASLGAALSAIVGFQIGDELFEQFEGVRRFGGLVALAFIRLSILIKGAFQSIGPAFRLSFFTAIDLIRRRLSLLAEDAADLIERLPGLGDAAAEQIRRSARGLAAGVGEGTTAARKALADVARDMRKELDDATKIVGQFIGGIGNALEAKNDLDEANRKPLAPQQISAIAIPVEEVERRAQAILDNQLSLLEDQRERDLVGLREYLAEKRRILEEQVDIEIEAAERALAAAKPGDRAKLETDLILLRQRRAQVTRDAAREEAEAERALLEASGALQAELLRQQQGDLQARTDDIRRQFQQATGDLQQFAQRIQDTQGLINEETGTARIDDFRDQARALVQTQIAINQRLRDQEINSLQDFVETRRRLTLQSLDIEIQANEALQGSGLGDAAALEQELIELRRRRAAATAEASQAEADAERQLLEITRDVRAELLGDADANLQERLQSIRTGFRAAVNDIRNLASGVQLEGAAVNTEDATARLQEFRGQFEDVLNAQVEINNRLRLADLNSLRDYLAEKERLLLGQLDTEIEAVEVLQSAGVGDRAELEAELVALRERRAAVTAEAARAEAAAERDLLEQSNQVREQLAGQADADLQARLARVQEQFQGAVRDLQAFANRTGNIEFAIDIEIGSARIQDFERELTGLVDAQLQVNERLRSEDLISERQYVATKRDLALERIEIEQQALAALDAAGAGGAADREERLIELRRQRAEVTQQASEAEAAATDRLRAQITALDAGDLDQRLQGIRDRFERTLEEIRQAAEDTQIGDAFVDTDALNQQLLAAGGRLADVLGNQLELNEQLRDQDLQSLSDYVQEKRRIILEQIDAEISANQALQQIDPGQRIQLERELIDLRERRSEVVRQTADEEIAAEERVRAVSLQALQQFGIAQSAELDRRLSETRQKFQQTIQELQRFAQNAGTITVADIDIGRAQIEQFERQFQDALDRQFQVNETLRNQDLISLRDYLAEKRRILLEQIDVEIAANEALVGADVQDRAALEAEIIRLRQQRTAVVQASAREEAAAERNIAAVVSDLRNQLLRAQGNELGARLNEIRTRFQQTIAQIESLGATEGVDIANRLFDVEVARARIDQLKQLATNTFTELAAQQRELVEQYESGALSRREASALADQATVSAREQVRLLVEEMYRLAEASGLPIDVSGIREFEDAAAGATNQIEELRQNAVRNLGQQINRDLAGGLTEALLNTRNAVGSLGDRLDDFARRFLTNIAEMILQQRIFNALQLGGGGGIGGGLAAAILHSGGIVGSAGRRRNIPAFAFAGAPRLHQGGVLGLRSDEVPAILQRGEEVLSRNDPRNSRTGGDGDQTPAQINLSLNITPELHEMRMRDFLDSELSNVLANR